MTDRQRDDLREALRKALFELDTDKSARISVVETKYDEAIPESMVILALENAVPDVVACVDAVMIKRAVAGDS